ncbi:MAG: ParA family protein [Thermoanaerobaculia bacterium]
MKILALYNFKGGVGKTSTAVHLAYLAARRGARTLLWDLDPQGAASYLYRVEGREKGLMKKLIEGEKELAELVRESDFRRLALVPADLSFRKFDLTLAAARRPAERFARLLRPLLADFDLLVLDCPPSLSLLAETLFSLSDALVVPLLPSPLSLRALEQIAQHLAKKGLADVAVLPFLSMVDRRKSLHRDPDWLEARSPYPLLGAQIPYSSAVEETTVRRQPLFEHAPTSPAARAYEQLWEEVEAKLAREG